MFLVNFLSRNDTDRYTPLFEIIYAIELIFILLAQIASLLVCGLVLTVRMQCLTKLRIVFTILLACFYVTTRLIVINHQYFGSSEYVETTALIFASMSMQTFISYMASLVLFLALDRLVATRAWSWYESNAISTLLFFALQEILHYFIAISLAYLIVYGYISSMHAVFGFAVIIIVGSSVFALVFRHNLRVLRELKRGAVINKYSISRSYQIRENVHLLTTYTRIARPLVFVCLPPFAFYPIFHLLPANIGYDGIRFLSASMYHLWLSMQGKCWSNWIAAALFPANDAAFKISTASGYNRSFINNYRKHS